MIMDMFGIGTAFELISAVYLQRARRTGRTSAMLSRLSEGDVVIFKDASEAARVARLCKQRGINISAKVARRADFQSIYELVQGSNQRIILDHNLIYELYLNGFKSIESEIDKLQIKFNKNQIENDLDGKPKFGWLPNGGI